MSQPSITQLLQAWSDGDPSALEQLAPLVEPELHRLALAYMRRERPGHTLQATALVNEVFLRFAGGTALRWHDRAHFIGVAARLMRQVLVDHARARNSQKRGGEAQPTALEHETPSRQPSLIDVIALDRAMRKLEHVDARKANVVDLRFFGGLTVEEAADVLGVSPETVKRDYRLAKLWLARELTGETAGQRRS